MIDCRLQALHLSRELSQLNAHLRQLAHREMSLDGLLLRPRRESRIALAIGNDAGDRGLASHRAPITNVGSLPTPARAGNGAYVGIAIGEHEGTANSNNALEAVWQFQLAKPEEGVTLELDFRAYVEAFVSAGELLPGKASASTDFEITLTDLATGIVVFKVQPDVANQTVSAWIGSIA